MTRMTVSCDIMRKIYSPMLEDVWNVGYISEEDVLSCSSLEKGDIPNIKVDDWTFNKPEYHIARIAWLGANGWEVEEEHNIKLHLDEYGMFLEDGNHRFSAALVFHENVTFDFYGDEEQFNKRLERAKKSLNQSVSA